MAESHDQEEIDRILLECADTGWRQIWFTRKEAARAVCAALKSPRSAADLPNPPKAFTVVHPPNSEPYGLFTFKQLIEYRLAPPGSFVDGGLVAGEEDRV